MAHLIIHSFFDLSPLGRLDFLRFLCSVAREDERSVDFGVCVKRERDWVGLGLFEVWSGFKNLERFGGFWDVFVNLKWF